MITVALPLSAGLTTIDSSLLRECNALDCPVDKFGASGLASARFMCMCMGYGQ